MQTVTGIILCQKNIPLAVFLLLISHGLYAAEIMSGQIFYADKTVDATFLIPMGRYDHRPNTETLQRGVRFQGSDGKMQWLRPHQAKGFRFKWRGLNYRMVSHRYVGSLIAATRSVFLLQLIDGPLKMFGFRVTNQNKDEPTISRRRRSVHYLLQRGEEPLKEPRWLGFRKKMEKYFADCPELVLLIEEREFKRRDVEEIVLYYNRQCN